MSEAISQLGEHVGAVLGKALKGKSIVGGELIVEIEGADLVRTLTLLRDDGKCLFQQLVDICGVDYPERPRRFDVVYALLSLKLNQRIRLKVQTDEATPLPTVCGVYKSAGWFEREVWDLYGVWFADHPDLRRILTDYGFDGHPMRKDFPLTGHVELRYDETRKRVVYEPVKLVQEFRYFDFLSPWEGMTRPLPGDEKAEKS